MQENENKEPFINGPMDVIGAICFGVIFLAIVGSVGQGSLELNIARLALIGMVIAGIAFWNKKISRKTFLVSEIILWIAMLIFSIPSNPAAVMVTILIPVFIGLSIVINRYDPKYH